MSTSIGSAGVNTRSLWTEIGVSLALGGLIGLLLFFGKHAWASVFGIIATMAWSVQTWRKAHASHPHSRMLAQVFEHGPFGVHVFSPAGRPIWSIPNLTRRRNLRSIDFVAEGIEDIRTHPMTRALGAVDAFSAAAEGKVTHVPARRLRYSVANNDQAPAETMWPAVSLLPVFDAQGAVEWVVAIIADTEQEQELQEKVDRTSRLAEVGVLMAGVAHEVNTPLTCASISLDTLTETLGPVLAENPNIEQITSEIGMALHRIARISEDLSAIARPSREAVRLVSVLQVAERVLHIMQPTLPDGVEVQTELSAVPLAHAAALRLEQVLTNLVQNAVRACPETGGKIILRTGTDPQGCPWMEVEDNGAGMSESVQARIFEPFFTTRRGGRGDGLGLYLVRCYLEDMGGTIHVQSAEGAGTTMRVTLHGIWQPAPDDTMPLPSSLRLLVVSEDPRIDRRLIELIPEVSDITTATSCDTARQMNAREPRWDICLVGTAAQADSARRDFPATLGVVEVDLAAPTRSNLIRAIRWAYAPAAH